MADVKKLESINFSNITDIKQIEENIALITNTISNGNYTICLKQNGEGFSKYNDILVFEIDTLGMDIRKDDLVKVRGQVTRRLDKYQIVVSNIEKI